MTNEERETRLKRMKEALRNARDERVETHAILSHYLDIAKHVRTVQDAHDIVTITAEARARNMLVLQRDDLDCCSFARPRTELARIVRRERYVKSPSVRALKAHNKGNDGPGD